MFWLWEKNGGRVDGTFYSFHGKILSKNMARITRRQLDGRHLLFGVYLQTWAALYLLTFAIKMHYRHELNIDWDKRVFSLFLNSHPPRSAECFISYSGSPRFWRESREDKAQGINPPYRPYTPRNPSKDIFRSSLRSVVPKKVEW